MRRKTTTKTKTMRMRRPSQTEVSHRSWVGCEPVLTSLLDFLDDEPHVEDLVHRPVPQNDDQGHDNAVALAAHYERAAADYQRDAAREKQVAASASIVSSAVQSQTAAQTGAAHVLADAEERKLAVVPGTWVRSRHRGKSRGLVAFVLSTTKLYIAWPPPPFIDNVTTRRAPDPHLANYTAYPPPQFLPEFDPDLDLQKRSKNQIMISKSGRPFTRKRYPSVIPSVDELALYADTRLPRLLELACDVPSPALAEGDRVVVVAGEQKGSSGFIAVLRKLSVRK